MDAGIALLGFYAGRNPTPVASNLEERGQGLMSACRGGRSVIVEPVGYRESEPDAPARRGEDREGSTMPTVFGQL